MTTFKIGSLSIDPVEIGIQGNAVLGIKDSGKSYSATFIAERLLESGIPFIAFDPTGIWRFMRMPGPGARGRGYPVVVAGGEAGDLPLTVAGAPEIVRAAMRNGVSLVIDLFDMRLSKADWRRIVTSCVRVLLHENKEHGMRHVFLEEAAEFVPQKVIDGDVYAQIERLARMGGNSRVGYTLINQRSQEVNKAVLELCENVFLHRQKGKNALENLSRWFDVAEVADQREIIKSLPTLPQGECWAWIGGDNPRPPTRVKMPAKNSLHPDRRVMRGDDTAVQAAAVDVGTFVTSMRTTLVTVEAEAKANDPRALRARIAELERAAGGYERSHVDAVKFQEAVAQAEQRGYDRAFAMGVRALSDFMLEGHKVACEARAAIETLEQWSLSVFDAVEGRAENSPSLLDAPWQDWERAGGVPIPPPPRSAPRVASSAPPPSIKPPLPHQSGTVNGGGDRPIGAERRPLAVLARVHPAGMTEAQWAVGAGLKRTGGTWATYLSRLRAAGRIERRGDEWFATVAGIVDVGEAIAPMPPPGRALVDWWAERLPGAGPMLMTLHDTLHGRWVTRDELADVLGITVSGGTFSTYLSRLRSPGLIEEDASKRVRLSPSLTR